MERIRLLLVDDNVGFLGTLREFLSGEEDMTVVGEATDGDQALRACGELRPDVVVMDVYMPRVDGLQATREIVRGCPGSRVIVITGQEAPELRSLSEQAGAVGFVSKPQVAARLRDAIRRAALADRSPPSSMDC